jgi:hypothetical protein
MKSASERNMRGAFERVTINKILLNVFPVFILILTKS